ncbi:hypothetical protein M405DRAFT_815412 [Rhizopogon salebrosus TDB-379]|nr:hypothetical protein M405DRAFT_815412 [Rhizopogon salebrosus TDB-379]
MNISTGNSSHHTLARPETLGCHISTRQNILPDFMYELDKRLASASMFGRLLFFLSRGMSISNPVIMSIADSRSSNSSHPHLMAVLRSHNMLCKYASTSNLTWWMQTRPTGNVLALGAYGFSEPTRTSSIQRAPSRYGQYTSSL